MKAKQFYMTADYIHEGIDKCEWFVIVAPDENTAVYTILNYLESQGKDVQCIINVLGVNSMDELKNFVNNGPKSGVHCIVHVFDQKEVKV